MEYDYITTIGQDSHRLHDAEDGFVLLGGVKIPCNALVEANSDGDTLLHAVTNAISGYTGVNILGRIADKMCLENGIKDSREYLKEALKYLDADSKLIHLSITIECKRPKLMNHIDSIRLSLSELLGIDAKHIGITATTGEGLTAFGKGEGIQVFCVLTVRSPLCAS